MGGQGKEEGGEMLREGDEGKVMKGDEEKVGISCDVPRNLC